MSADPLEGSERARQEWLKSLPECIGYDGGCDGGLLNEPHEDNCPMKGHLDPNLVSTWDAAYEAGRRSLEQERDELRDMLRQAYHFVPFGWAGRAKLENLLDKGDS